MESPSYYPLGLSHDSVTQTLIFQFLPFLFRLSCWIISCVPGSGWWSQKRLGYTAGEAHSLLREHWHRQVRVREGHTLEGRHNLFYCNKDINTYVWDSEQLKTGEQNPMRICLLNDLAKFLSYAVYNWRNSDLKLFLYVLWLWVLA